MARREDVFVSIRLLGAILIVAGCGSFGFLLSGSCYKDMRLLRQIVNLLDHMRSELQYHMTPLPDLCRNAASVCEGKLQLLFLKLADKLEDQTANNADECMTACLTEIPMQGKARQALRQLGRCLGTFDLSGQLLELEAVRAFCERGIETISKNKSLRNRSYQTLGLCAGAALAILFI